MKVEEKNNDQKSLGIRLKRAREDAGWTRKVLAERTDIPMRTLEKYEGGITEIGAGRLKELCAALDVSHDQILLGETENESVQSDRFSPMPLAQVEPVSEAERLADAIRDLFADGLDKAPRRTIRLLGDLEQQLAYFEVGELIIFAEEQNVLVGDKLAVDESGGNENQLEEIENASLEIARRIADSTLFGFDLYGLEQRDITRLADWFDIDTGLFFSSSRNKLIPEMRADLRRAFAHGETVEGFQKLISAQLSKQKQITKGAA